MEPGTLVSLISDTSAASIFYWIETGTEPTRAENSRYGSSIYMKPEYADADGNVVVRAYATKDGYQNSRTTELKYHLNIPEVIPDSATISVGSVSSKSGEVVSPTLSIHTSNSDAKIGRISRETSRKRGHFKEGPGGNTAYGNWRTLFLAALSFTVQALS